MASVRSKGSDKWEVTINLGVDGEGKRKRIFRTIEAKTEKSAQKKADQLEGQLKERGVNTSKFTFSEYVEKVWIMDTRDLARKTKHEYERLLHSRILPTIGNIKLTKIDSLMLERFYNKLRQSGANKRTGQALSEISIKHVHRLISQILETARKRKLIRTNPCKDIIKPPKSEKDNKKYENYPINDLVRALDQAPLKYKTISYIALLSGARIGEIMGLCKSDIDFQNGSININKSSQYLPKMGTFIKDKPKTEASNRVIPVPQKILDLLSELILDTKKQQLLLGSKWHASDQIFVAWNGRTLNTYIPTSWFGKFIKENNLPHITFHGLRHLYGSIYLERHKNILEVSQLLGHANSNITSSTYLHILKKINGRESKDRRKAEEMAELLL